MERLELINRLCLKRQVWCFSTVRRGSETTKVAVDGLLDMLLLPVTRLQVSSGLDCTLPWTCPWRQTVYQVYNMLTKCWYQIIAFLHNTSLGLITLASSARAGSWNIENWNLISEMASVAEVNIMFFCDVCVRVLLLQPESQLAGSFGCRLGWKHSWKVVIASRIIHCQRESKGYNFNFMNISGRTNQTPGRNMSKNERCQSVSSRVYFKIFQERIQLNDHLQDNLLASLRKLPFLC